MGRHLVLRRRDAPPLQRRHLAAVTLPEGTRLNDIAATGACTIWGVGHANDTLVAVPQVSSASPSGFTVNVPRPDTVTTAPRAVSSWTARAAVACATP